MALLEGDKIVRKDENTAKEKLGRQPASRPTIGLLAYGPADPNNYAMWSGVADVAREQGANLICFPGNPLRSPHGFEAQANVLYNLVSAENVDGLVIWGGILAHHVDLEEVRILCERYRPLPMASIGLSLGGIPSVAVDNYQGMRDAAVHLIEVHGYRRIAYVRGPEGFSEAEERYRAYADVLAEHGLVFDPDLVAPGDFMKPSGIAAVHLLLDQRKISFEAVLVDGDVVATGVIEALEARGNRVPGGVAVTGFDDVAESRYVVPPLTTLRYPFYEQGRQAAEMVLALLGGEEVPAQVTQPMTLVVRQSCGCLDPAVAQAAAGRAAMIPKGHSAGEPLAAALLASRSTLLASRSTLLASRSTLLASRSTLLASRSTLLALRSTFAARREGILSEMVQAVRDTSARIVPGWAEQLLDAFSAELGGELTGAFLSALGEVLRQVASAGGDVGAWQGALSALRRHALPCLDDGGALSRAEDLWQQARVLIGEAAQRAQAYERLQAEQQAQTLREIGQALITTFGITELMDVAARELPRLGIPSCYLSLYEQSKSPTEWSRLILAYNEGGRVELEETERRFPSRQLAPGGMSHFDRRYSMVVEPLYFREDHLGFVLFEAGPREEKMCDTLRGQLSSALQGALLVQQVRSRALQLQTAAEVSRAASSTLDPDALIQQVVDLARERFDLYYAGLFLVDEAGEWSGEPGRWAVLRAGTGEAGRQMLERKHKLEIGSTSMIGWCVANQQARIALDVGDEAVRFENPLLPETRSELALPLVSRGQVIGALTIQSTQEAAFSDEDIAVLQTMADQLASAIQNARLLRETQQAARELGEERNLLRTLIDNTPDLIYGMDTKGRFVLANMTIARSVGAASPDELLGKTNFDFHPPEEATQLDATDQRVIQSGQPLINYEEASIDQAGNKVWTLTNEVPLRDSQGKVVAALGISRDITELKQAEARLERRALQLQAAAEVARDATTARNLDELLNRAVNLVRDRFGFYHAGIFLVDDQGEYAVLAAATGEAGRAMLERGYKLRVGEVGIVSYVTASGQPRIALDVGADAVYFKSPLLPETRSEMALPLKVGGRVIGALDAQSQQVAAFDDDDVRVLQTMADQLAVAIQNVRLLHETQQTVRELEAAQGRYTQASWRAFVRGANRPHGYRYRRLGVEPAAGQYPEAREALQQGRPIVTTVQVENQGGPLGAGDKSTSQSKYGQNTVGALAVPIKLRDQVIGTLNLRFEDETVLPETVSLVEEVANRLALVLENARLMHEAQGMVLREQQINLISTQVRSSISLETILQNTVRELGKALGASRTFIQLGVEQGGPLPSDDATTGGGREA